MGHAYILKSEGQPYVQFLSLDPLFTVHRLLLSFCIEGIFSKTIRARAMKLGSCLHLEELRSILCSILRLDLLFTVH